MNDNEETKDRPESISDIVREIRGGDLPRTDDYMERLAVRIEEACARDMDEAFFMGALAARPKSGNTAVKRQALEEAIRLFSGKIYYPDEEQWLKFARAALAEGGER